MRVWPASFESLPRGEAARGRKLFIGRFGCLACHGVPGLTGSNSVGPALEGVTARAAARRPGASVHQYLYESITNPSAFLADSPLGAAADGSTRMPEYDLTLQEAADLVAFVYAVAGDT